MILKIAFLNNSGNVGKSTICKNMFETRIPNAEIIKIETINSDGTNDEKLSAKDIVEIFERMDTTDIALIDIGASNIELLMEHFEKIEGSILDIDYFVIPTIDDRKIQDDTISTYNKLVNMGVDPECIKVIFNKVDSAQSLDKQFSVLFESDELEDLNLSDVDNQFIIEESQLFEMLGRTGFTYGDILNDKRDFRQLISAAETKEEKSILSKERMAFRLVSGFDKKIDKTFKKLISTTDIVFI